MSRQGDTITLVLLAGAAGVAYIVQDHLSTPFDKLFDSAAERYSLNPNLLRAIARHESGLKPNAIGHNDKPSEGVDLGLMQINEHTAKRLGVARTALMRPEVSIDTAARLLQALKQELRDRLSLHTLVSAYNAGSPTVLKRGIINPKYVASVTYHMQLYSLGRMFQ